MSKVHKNETLDFEDTTKAFESTDLGQAVSADIDDIANTLKEHILEKLVETYDLAAEISSDNPKNHFSTFQGLLRDFKDWDLKTRQKFSRKVKRDLKDVESLIRSSIIGVSQIRFSWLAKTKGYDKRETNKILQAISLSRIIPSTEDFLHWCCCRSVKEVYQHPYLFDNRKSLSKTTKQENIKNLKTIIQKAISDELYSRENASCIIKSAVSYVKGSSHVENNKNSDEDEYTEPDKSSTDISSKNISSKNISSKNISSKNTKNTSSKNKSNVNKDSDDENYKTDSSEEKYWSLMRKKMKKQNKNSKGGQSVEYENSDDNEDDNEGDEEGEGDDEEDNEGDDEDDNEGDDEDDNEGDDEDDNEEDNEGDEEEDNDEDDEDDNERGERNSSFWKNLQNEAVEKLGTGKVEKEIKINNYVGKSKKKTQGRYNDDDIDNNLEESEGVELNSDDD